MSTLPSHPSSTMTIDPETTASIHKIWDKIHTPKNNAQPTFPETIAALADLGVSRYRVDFISSSTSAYLSTQWDEYMYTNHVSDLNPGTIAWSLEKLRVAVEEAAALAEKGEGDNVEFCRKVVQAGVVEYAVYIDGKKVVYFGPMGEMFEVRFRGHGGKVEVSESGRCCVM